MLGDFGPDGLALRQLVAYDPLLSYIRKTFRGLQQAREGGGKSMCSANPPLDECLNSVSFSYISACQSDHLMAEHSSNAAIRQFEFTISSKVPHAACEDGFPT